MAFINLHDEDDPQDDDGSMFGPKPGTWYVSCPSDPRWNGSGHARVGLFSMPGAVVEHLNAKVQELGAEPPADCEWGYMKD